MKQGGWGGVLNSTHGWGGAQEKGSMGRKRGDRVQLVGKKVNGGRDERVGKQNEMRGLLSNLCSCMRSVVE